MKQVNLITTLSPQQRQLLYSWFALSTMLIIATLITATALIGPELYTLYLIHQKTNALQQKSHSYQTTLSTNSALQKEQETLQTQRSKINSYVMGAKNPLAAIDAIVSNCNNDTSLEYVKKNKKEYEIALMCTKAENATHYIDALIKTSLFTTLKLISLHHNDNNKGVRCIIKGY